MGVQNIIVTIGLPNNLKFNDESHSTNVQFRMYLRSSKKRLPYAGETFKSLTMLT